MITDDEWNLFLQKYDKLLRTIARKISGDDMVASIDDNYGDLCIAALESIKGFRAKTGMEFSEAINTKLFDQYTKTVLWNRKAKKGVGLTKRMEFRSNHVPLYTKVNGEEEAWDIEDTSASASNPTLELNFHIDPSDEDVRKVVNAIIENPSVVTKEGKLKVHSLVSPTGLSPYFLDKALNRLKRTLNKVYNAQ